MIHRNILFASVACAFSVGYGFGTFFNNEKPCLAATIVNPPPSNNSVQDLVPLNKPRSNDDLAMLANANRTTTIMKHGYPSLDNLRVFENYVLSYDRRNRVANWVFEHLSYENMRSAEDTDRGKSEFKEDQNIHPYFRSTNQDYKGSGYDRGHMAAAANHRKNQKLMDQTFFLSNMAPQVGQGFNRDKWNDLEREVRNLVKKYDNVWVVTGPLYLPKLESDNKSYVKYEVIGSHNVAVPTHFFKVVLCEKQGVYSLYPYVLPNQPCENSTPLSSYIVPLDSIERAAGLILFDKLPRNQLKLMK